MTIWQFDTEFSLEEFLWVSLEPLLSLKSLARQYSTEGQICDILATTSDRQLVVLELKNVEDRYVVPQLTRYYASLRKEQPFADQVDYSLPIRLIAIAPTFHTHNYVDREHSQLDFEFWTFAIDGLESEQVFHLKALDIIKTTSIEISSIFQKSLQPAALSEELPGTVRVIGRPPKPLRDLLNNLEHDQQEYLLALRRKILEFDERMAEVGLSKRTQYGLMRGAKGIPDSRVCAEFLPRHLSFTGEPDLYLMLPYPKGGVQKLKDLEPIWGKGYALARVPLLQKDWEKPIVGFFVGKGRQNPSGGYTFSIKLYTHLCNKLLDGQFILTTTEALIDLALQEWRSNLGS
jgi:RecB family endonuclease NucS